MMTSESHNAIVEAMDKAGLSPVVFEKPLKSIYALVKLTKYIKPDNLAECSQAVGWGIGTLLDSFGKELFSIKSLTINNDKDGVFIEAILTISGLTFEDDHISWLDRLIANMAGESYPSHGYCWVRAYWKWDRAERISDVMGFTQLSGDGTRGDAL